MNSFKQIFESIRVLQDKIEIVNIKIKQHLKTNPQTKKIARRKKITKENEIIIDQQ